MKVKMKVINESARPMASAIAARLVANPLVRNPLVALAGHLAGLLLRLLPRRSGKRSFPKGDRTTAGGLSNDYRTTGPGASYGPRSLLEQSSKEARTLHEQTSSNVRTKWLRPPAVRSRRHACASGAGKGGLSHE